MTADDAATPTGTGMKTSRLRLQRIFLLSLVTSLGTCAFVAVVALLWGNFNQTTGQILSTLGALAIHSGIAMVCATALERRYVPKLSTAGLVLFAISFVVLVTCIWVPGWFDLPTVRAVGSSGALLAAYILAIPNASLAQRPRQLALGLLGLAVCALAFLMVLTCIWADSADSEVFAKATGIAALGAFSFAHMALLLRIPGADALRWLLRGTIACLWAVALFSSVLIIYEVNAEPYIRILGALGVVDASGTLALLIMAKLRQVGKVQKLETTPAQIELRCPRCTLPQTVTVGASKCTSCGLNFRIEIEEPRCVKCNYLLWQLPERRCPECGTTF